MPHLGTWLRGVRALFSPQPRRRQRRHHRPTKARRPVRLGFDRLEDRTLPAVTTGTGLTAQYYSDKTLTTLKVTRVDSTININNTATQSPAPGVGATNYSVRWSGQVQAVSTGPTTFYFRADDGVRVKFDGVTKVNDWTDHPTREYSFTVNLTAGQRYSLEVEFYQNLGGSVAQLSWATPGAARTLVPASQLYAVAQVATSQPPNATLNAPNVTGTSNAYTFSVTYTDDGTLNVGSLGNGDVRVNGPNGFAQQATFVSYKVNNDHSWTATYRITPPGGTWDAADNGSYSVYLQYQQVADSQGLFVGARTLGYFGANLTAVSDWYSQNLADDGVETLARSLGADHSFSRADMLALFHQVESGGVSAAELSDLRKLVANGATLGMPEYVRNLAGKVVNGDPANAMFQGKALGNLAAGSSAATLDLLVDKWFRGEDHPALNVSGVGYTLAAGTLFGSSGPQYTDIKQGQASDCYFLAALSEIALKTPQKIRDAFIDNGDGTFTVRFFKNGVADYVTVDKYLPTTTAGNFWFAGLGNAAGNANNKLWVGLLEKAYAQLAESGWSRATRANSYAVIDQGWEGDVLKQLVNVPATAATLSSTTATLNAIVAAMNAGKMVSLDSKDKVAAGIVPNHVYVITGYNSSTQTFTLWNPWGSTVQLTWSQVAANFNYYTASA